MAKVTLSATVFDNLVKQLAEIEDGRMDFLQEYFYKPSSERAEIEKLMEVYIDKLDQLVRSAHKSATQDNRVPFVTKDSEVEIQDLDNQKTFIYRVVDPSQSVRGRDISVLSPVGKSLLLKKAGEEVEIKAPGGVFRYKINSIRM